MTYKTFRAFELNISSCYELPGLPITQNTPDVVVRKSDILSVDNAENKKKWVHETTGHSCKLQIPDIGTFLIENGNKITVSPPENANESSIKLSIIGTCLSVILNQRNIFQIHGCAINYKGKAILFAGDSGCGKSTLVNNFIKKGYQLITDDVSALKITDRKTFVVPSYPQSKLWEASLEQLAYEKNDLHLVHEDMSKRALPIEKESFATQSIQLDKIYFMENESQSKLQIDSITGGDKITNIIRYLYRPRFIDSIDIRKQFFSQAIIIANQSKMFSMIKDKVPFEEYQDLINQVEKHFTTDA